MLSIKSIQRKFRNSTKSAHTNKHLPADVLIKTDLNNECKVLHRQFHNNEYFHLLCQLNTTKIYMIDIAINGRTSKTLQTNLS